MSYLQGYNSNPPPSNMGSGFNGSDKGAYRSGGDNFNGNGGGKPWNKPKFDRPQPMDDFTAAPRMNKGWRN